jgi:hypothetical protein
MIKITMMALYPSWLARNEAQESRKIQDSVSIAKHSICLIEEWQCPGAQDRQGTAAQREMALGLDENQLCRCDVEKFGEGWWSCGHLDHDERFIAGACHPPSLSLYLVQRTQNYVLTSNDINVIDSNEEREGNYNRRKYIYLQMLWFLQRSYKEISLLYM